MPGIPDAGIDITSGLNEFNHKLFIVDKQSGPTSFEVVKALRSAARVKKAGHAGTLDPLAEGVLLLMTGKATRAASFFMELKKSYRFDVNLGVGTTTLDREGEIVERVRCPQFQEQELVAAANGLIGAYDQTPPLYSAVKHNGTRLYKLARKGEAPDVKKRPVTIYRFDILEISLPVVRCMIDCSRGTYVRSVARDFGAALSMPAHVSGLARESIGPFRRDRAFPSDRIFDGNLDGLAGMRLEEALEFLPGIVLNERSIRALLNGIAPGHEDIVDRIGPAEPERPVRLLDETGNLIAVGKKGPDQHANGSPIVDSYRLLVDITS